MYVCREVSALKTRGSREWLAWLHRSRSLDHLQANDDHRAHDDRHFFMEQALRPPIAARNRAA